MTAQGRAGERNVLNQSFFQPCVPQPMSKIDAVSDQDHCFKPPLAIGAYVTYSESRTSSPWKGKGNNAHSLGKQPDKGPAHSKSNSHPCVSQGSPQAPSPKRVHSPPLPLQSWKMCQDEENLVGPQ